MEIIIYVLVGWLICGLGATAYVIYDDMVRHGNDFKYEDISLTIGCILGGVFTVGYLLHEVHVEMLRENPVLFKGRKSQQEEE